MIATIGLAQFAVQMLFGWILPNFFEQFSELLNLPFVRRFVPAILGAPAGSALEPSMMMAMVWVHPVVLALLWTYAVWSATRLPVAEVDRGTIDVLLSLPVTRRALFATEAVIGLAGGIVVVGLGFLGNILGASRVDPEIIGTVAARGLVSLNLFAVFAAVFGISAAVSAMSDRRGRAVAAILVVLIASFLLNFLAVYHEGFKRLAFLSLLEYYRPIFLLQGQGRPARDIACLLTVGLLAWLTAAGVFQRRDVRTV